MRVSEQLVRRSATEPAGTLRVAVAPLLGEVLLPAVISEYLDRYPKMRVELHLASEYLDLRRSHPVTGQIFRRHFVVAVPASTWA